MTHNIHYNEIAGWYAESSQSSKEVFMPPPSHNHSQFLDYFSFHAENGYPEFVNHGGIDIPKSCNASGIDTMAYHPNEHFSTEYSGNVIESPSQPSTQQQREVSQFYSSSSEYSPFSPETNERKWSTLKINNPCICKPYFSSQDASSSASSHSFMETPVTSQEMVESFSEKNESDRKGNKKKKRKDYGGPKICGVCGDKAKSMHFGGMACDSCKAFFRRSVQSNSWQNFQCAESKNCPIVKDSRKLCQYCRFAKCRTIGMEVGWVMTESERMAMWKSKLAKQRNEKSNTKSFTNSSEASQKVDCYAESLPDMSPVDPIDMAAIVQLKQLQQAVFRGAVYPPVCVGDNTESLANTFLYLSKVLTNFFFRVEDFYNLPKEEQALIIEEGVAKSIYIHGAYMFDVKLNCWPSDTCAEYLKCPYISLDNLRKLVTHKEAFTTLYSFYCHYGNCIKDEESLCLLCLMALFQPLSNKENENVADIYYKYSNLLRLHIMKIEKGDCGKAFQKHLMCLEDVKKVTEFHTKVEIKPTMTPEDLAVVPKASFSYHVLQVSNLIREVIVKSLPEFASVFSEDEIITEECQKQRQTLWTFMRVIHDLPNPRVQISYHPLTVALFGDKTSTDELLEPATLLSRISSLLVSSDSVQPSCLQEGNFHDSVRTVSHSASSRGSFEELLWITEMLVKNGSPQTIAVLAHQLVPQLQKLLEEKVPVGCERSV